jgi:hypothetical protein
MSANALSPIPENSKPKSKSRSIIIHKKGGTLNTSSEHINQEDNSNNVIGPGAYNYPTCWKKSYLSHFKNNPSFTFSKTAYLERVDSYPINMLPGVGKYNADGLFLKKKMPRTVMTKTQRFTQQPLAGSSDIASGENTLRNKIHGVFI